MTRTLCAMVLGIACVACGRDVRLGTVPADAASDVAIDSPSGNPFNPGAYTLHFLGPESTSCMGTLGPSDEAAFVGITTASLGLVDGPVTLVTPSATLMNVAGTPVASAVGQTNVDFVPGDPNSSPDVWGGAGPAIFGSGPLTTTNTMTFLAADSLSANMPSGVQGALGILYETANGMGACTVAFGILFTQP